MCVCVHVSARVGVVCHSPGCGHFFFVVGIAAAQGIKLVRTLQENAQSYSITSSHRLLDYGDGYIYVQLEMKNIGMHRASRWAKANKISLTW